MSDLDEGVSRSVYDDAQYTAMVKALISRRQRINLSQREVASRAGMSQSQISTFESLAKRASPSMLIRWARALRVNAKVEVVLEAAEWPQPVILDLSGYSARF